jgi:hypothetical protein
MTLREAPHADYAADAFGFQGLVEAAEDLPRAVGDQLVEREHLAREHCLGRVPGLEGQEHVFDGVGSVVILVRGLTAEIGDGFDNGFQHPGDEGGEVG